MFRYLHDRLHDDFHIWVCKKYLFCGSSCQFYWMQWMKSILCKTACVKICNYPGPFLPVMPIQASVGPVRQFANKEMLGGLCRFWRFDNLFKNCIKKIYRLHNYFNFRNKFVWNLQNLKFFTHPASYIRICEPAAFLQVCKNKCGLVWIGKWYRHGSRKSFYCKLSKLSHIEIYTMYKTLYMLLCTMYNIQWLNIMDCFD